MRKTKAKIAVIAMAGLMLTGCGEAAYNLTESEESIIVNYAAHMVTKYNTYQKEGLTYVDPEEVEEESEEVALETEVQESDTTDASGLPGNATPEGTDEEQTSLSGAELSELFGQEDRLTFEYVGARLDTSYVENSYYALQADKGYTYLILGIDVTNTSEETIDIDYLTRQPKFSVILNGEVRSPAESTILMEDFSTLECTLKPGETKETVVLFQVPDTVESVDDLSLEVSIDGNNYQIIL